MTLTVVKTVKAIQTPTSVVPVRLNVRTIAAEAKVDTIARAPKAWWPRITPSAIIPTPFMSWRHAPIVAGVRASCRTSQS